MSLFGISEKAQCSYEAAPIPQRLKKSKKLPLLPAIR